MDATLDLAGDLGHKDLCRYLAVYPLPEHVKAACRDSEQLEKLAAPEVKSPRVYADARRYQFPVHTADATLLSHVYFLEKGAQLDPTSRRLTGERLEKMAGYWGVAPQAKRLTEKRAELDRTEDLPDESYALVWQRDDGQKTRQYRLGNPEEVKAAAAWFSERLPQLRQQYDYLDRRKIAQKILAKASSFGVSLGEHEEPLERASGRGIPNPHKIAGAITARVARLRKLEPKVKEAMLNLARHIKEQPAMLKSAEMSAKLGQQLDQFDRTYGLVNCYSDWLPAPEDVLYGLTFAKASAAAASCCGLMNGTVWDSSDFSKLSSQDLEDLFGEEFALQSLSGLRVDPVKVAELAATLPRPDADTFDRLMQEKGAKPVTKSASGCGLSREDLRRLAAT